MIEIVTYVDPRGRDVFNDWLDGLRDDKTVLRIAVRLERLKSGNLGDAKALGRGLHELRFSFGPGYRVYFSRLGKTYVLLLCAGDKSRQAEDIDLARKYLADYQQRVRVK